MRNPKIDIRLKACCTPGHRCHNRNNNIVDGGCDIRRWQEPHGHCDAAKQAQAVGKQQRTSKPTIYLKMFL